MGMLRNIFSKIFPPSHPAVTQPVDGMQGASQQGAGGGAQQAAGTAQQGAAGASQQSAAVAPSATSGPAAAPPGQAASAQPATAPVVDVEAVLNDMAHQAGQPLNWRTSIVDLLKLLNLDSSLQARKELARELNYTGDMNDSAAMNLWLHRQVMVKLAANGGKLPPDLRT